MASIVPYRLACRSRGAALRKRDPPKTKKRAPPEKSAGSVYATIHTGVFTLNDPHRQGILKSFAPGTIAGKLRDTDTPLNEIDGYRNLSAGLAVGLACLCSGAGMGRFMQQVARPVPFVPTTTNRSTEPEQLTEWLIPTVADRETPTAVAGGMLYLYLLPVLVFMEAIGLYRLIAALILMSKA
eukprot:scaffold55342_cov34-Attheya_sp.AAC.1